MRSDGAINLSQMKYIGRSCLLLMRSNPTTLIIAKNVSIFSPAHSIKDTRDLWSRMNEITGKDSKTINQSSFIA